MRKVVVIEHLTLDGVMQAPGRPIDSQFAHSCIRTVRGRAGEARRADPCPSPSVEDRCSSACALWVSPIGTWRT
jgi:hypothetical protein